MEIKITRFVKLNAHRMHDFSNSIARSGREDIGSVTWRNACAAMADPSDWFTNDLDALQSWFADFGAWDREELEAMPGQELNALLLQFLAGDYQSRAEASERGRAELKRWEENEGGRLYRHKGQWYFSIGC